MPDAIAGNPVYVYGPSSVLTPDALAVVESLGGVPLGIGRCWKFQHRDGEEVRLESPLPVKEGMTPNTAWGIRRSLPCDSSWHVGDAPDGGPGPFSYGWTRAGEWRAFGLAE